MTDTRKLEKTNTPGIFKRGDRYVVIWRHRGKQHKSYHRTLAEAREAKGLRAAGYRRPRSRVKFGDYFETWIESYAGRTARGFSETTRPEDRRPIEHHRHRTGEPGRSTTSSQPTSSSSSAGCATTAPASPA